MSGVRHLRPVARAFLATLAVLVLALAAAQAAVAELTVTAYGEQRFDLASGRTVLVDGGEVTDRASGVHLRAEWIAYVEGERLEARSATVDGPLGVLRAPVVEIDLVVGRVLASEGVTLERAGLVATAARLGYDATTGLAWLAGEVRASAPDAAAAEAWIDVHDGRLLLVGPYRFSDGLFTLEGGADARLQLDPLPDDLAGYDARTDVDAELSARVAEVAASLADAPAPTAGE